VKASQIGAIVHLLMGSVTEAALCARVRLGRTRKHARSPPSFAQCSRVSAPRMVHVNDAFSVSRKRYGKSRNFVEIEQVVGNEAEPAMTRASATTNINAFARRP
jgi:hypothetical protein